MATTSSLYYVPGRPCGFSTLPKLRAAVGRKGTTQLVGTINAWLSEQDAYKLHRPVMKRFTRNPYTVSNVLDAWECDLLDYRPTQNTMTITDKFCHKCILEISISDPRQDKERT